MSVVNPEAKGVVIDLHSREVISMSAPMVSLEVSEIPDFNFHIVLSSIDPFAKPIEVKVGGENGYSKEGFVQAAYGQNGDELSNKELYDFNESYEIALFEKRWQHFSTQTNATKDLSLRELVEFTYIKSTGRYSRLLDRILDVTIETFGAEEAAKLLGQPLTATPEPAESPLFELIFIDKEMFPDMVIDGWRISLPRNDLFNNTLMSVDGTPLREFFSNQFSTLSQEEKDDLISAIFEGRCRVIDKTQVGDRRIRFLQSLFRESEEVANQLGLTRLKEKIAQKEQEII